MLSRRPFDCSVIIPCFNESDRLDLDQFESFLKRNPFIQLVFVDDGSEDETSECLEERLGLYSDQVHILRLEENKGKGEAIRFGMCHVFDQPNAPNYIGYLDADLATPLEDLMRGLDILMRRVDIFLLLGIRVQLSGHRVRRTFHRFLLGRAFSTAVSLAFGINVRDTQCGAKLFRNEDCVRRIFETPFVDRWLFDVEILARFKAIFGVGSQSAIYEYPLESWTEVAGSKLNTMVFLNAPKQFLKLVLAYRVFSKVGYGTDSFRKLDIQNGFPEARRSEARSEVINSGHFSKAA